jgi:hypothetical protein
MEGAVDMKHLKIAGLFLVSIFVMCMALAGNASAAPLWLLCLEGTGLTKYSSNQCTAAEAGGKWQSAGLPAGKTDTIRIENITIRLVDKEAGPLKEKAAVKCDGAGIEGSGVIEGPNKEVVKEVKIGKAKERCERVEGPCKSGEVESVEARDLPWKSELFETEKVVQERLEADGGGEPGWAVKCNTVLGSKTDTCTYEEGKNETLTPRPLLSSFRILISLENLGDRKLKCSEASKSETGEGLFTGGMALSNGNGLSISPS